MWTYANNIKGKFTFEEIKKQLAAIVLVIVLRNFIRHH